MTHSHKSNVLFIPLNNLWHVVILASFLLRTLVRGVVFIRSQTQTSLVHPLLFSSRLTFFVRILLVRFIFSPSRAQLLRQQISIMQECKQGAHSSPPLPRKLQLSNRFAFLDGLEGGTRTTHAPEMTSIPPEASANHINRVIVSVRPNNIARSQSDFSASCLSGDCVARPTISICVPVFPAHLVTPNHTGLCSATAVRPTSVLPQTRLPLFYPATEKWAFKIKNEYATRKTVIRAAAPSPG